MANLYELYETDPELEKKGIALQFGDTAFYVKRAGGANVDFDKCFEAKTRNMTSRLQLSALSEEQSSTMLQEVYFESVIVGWKNVTNRKGEVLDFNRENWMQVMKDLPTVWRAIRTEASNHENFRKLQAQQEGEAVGNF